MSDTVKLDAIGQISEGILGSLDLYIVDKADEVSDIYNHRVSNELSLKGRLDEFYFLAPADKSIGMKGNTTTNNTSVFKPFTLGKEPYTLWKARYQYVGHFYELVEADSLGKKANFKLDSSAYFTLPKIPSEMVAKIDKLFRTVDDKFGTESIIVLTYDYAYLDTDEAPNGWGFAVPEQKNTSVHCDYDREEIEAQLADGVVTVGTIHSHPGMKAYASDVDRKDQQHFDGLHITYGWAHNSQETEYYAELVCNREFFEIDPKHVLDLEDSYLYEVHIGDHVYTVNNDDVKIVKNDFDIKDEEIEELIKDIEKAPVPTVNSGYSNYGYGLPTGGGTPKVTGGSSHRVDTSDYFPQDLPKGYLSFPTEKYPDPRETNIFVRVNSNTVQCCPLCGVSWDDWKGHILDRRQCMGCGTLILRKSDNIKDADQARITRGYTPFANFLNIDLPYSILTEDNSGSLYVQKSGQLKVDNGVVQEGGSPKVQASNS